jgi:NAD(P)-dependent dehydrogenase (short-subunit alcohol dehydrogenase family)
MFIIVGDTGHIGAATAGALLEQRQPVTVVTGSAAKGEQWRNRGAEVANRMGRVICGVSTVSMPFEPEPFEDGRR